MTDKKTRTPRNAESILAGAIKLPLADRVALLKALQADIQKEVNDLQAAAEEAAKLVKQ